MSTDHDELARQFSVAVRWFQDRMVTLPVRLAWRDRVFLYSCYKQATAGDNNSPMPPSSARADRRQMWREWLRRKGQTRQHSMADYLIALDSLARHFDYSLLSSEQLRMRDRFLSEMGREELGQAVKESETRRAGGGGSGGQQLADGEQGRTADSAAADEEKQPSAQDSSAAASTRTTTSSPSPPAATTSAPAAAGKSAASTSPSSFSTPSLATLQAANDASLSSLTSSLSALSSALAAPCSGQDRISQLQQEMAALLSALEQRTAAAGEQWKQSERRWEERLSRVQQMQEEMRRRLDSRHGTEAQQSRTGRAQGGDGGGGRSWAENSLVAAGSAIVIAYGAYRVWRWYVHERR